MPRPDLRAAWLLAVGALCASATGQPLLIGADATAAANLLRINPATGATTIIGPMGARSVASLAFDPLHGVLYGTTTQSPTESNLVRINPATGAATVIGPLGVLFMHGLEYNPLDDTLYGVASGSPSALYRINPLTGAASLVASMPLNGLFGIAFDAGFGVMYAAHMPGQSLHRLNLSTGALTLIGPFGAPGNPFPQVGVSMAFDPTLGLFAIDNTGIASNASLLYRIDTTTGHATLVGPTIVANILGLAFVPAPCYANCDASTGTPALNVNDFVCFQTRFAAADPYADCDHSSSLNVNDFVCFQTAFAAACR